MCTNPTPSCLQMKKEKVSGVPRERKFSAEVASFALSFERYIETDTDKEIDRKTRERVVGEGVQQSLFTRVIDKHICFFFFYIQPRPSKELL